MSKTNDLEKIIADHNKEVRTDMASEITGGTRSKAITDVITVKALLKWHEEQLLEARQVTQHQLNRLELKLKEQLNEQYQAGKSGRNNSSADTANYLTGFVIGLLKLKQGQSDE